MGEGVIQNKQNGAFSATELHLSNLPSGRPGSLGTPQHTSSVRRASSSIVQDRTSTSDLQLSRHNSLPVAHEKATKCQNPNCNKYAGGNKVSAPKFCCMACKNSKGTRHGPRCAPYQIIKSGEGDSLKCTIFKNPRYVKVAEEKILGGTSAAIVIENGGENDEEAATAVPNKRLSDVQSILSNEEMNTAVVKVQGNRFCKESSVSSESSDSESDDFVIVKQSDFYVIVRPLPCTEC